MNVICNMIYICTYLCIYYNITLNTKVHTFKPAYAYQYSDMGCCGLTTVLRTHHSCLLPFIWELDGKPSTGMSAGAPGWDVAPPGHWLSVPDAGVESPSCVWEESPGRHVEAGSGMT